MTTVDLHHPRVLISHELTSYAEPLAIVLAERRPTLDVRLVASSDLESAVAAAPGAIVVTDRLTSGIEANAGGWLLYFPGHENLVLVGGASGQRRIESPRFHQVLEAIDELVGDLFVPEPSPEPLPGLT